MKNFYCMVICLSFVLTANLSGKNKVIENPPFEAINTGIQSIEKIEWNDKETRLHVKSTFIPNWWVMFSKKHYIQNSESEEKLYAVDIIHGEFDKKIFMPASGDSTMILIFPPLDKKVKKIDFGEDDKTCIWGISLDRKAKPVSTEKGTPESIEKWMSEELDKATMKRPITSNDPFFTANGSARLIGYIDGYDERYGFNTGIVYASNDITREDFPVVVVVHPDGRFEADVPCTFPTNSYLSLHKLNTTVYLQPGSVTALVVSWDDFLLSDRYRNRRFECNVDYRGPLARICNELDKTKFTQRDYSKMEENMQKPYADLKQEAINAKMESMGKLAGLAESGDYDPLSLKLMEFNILAQYCETLFDNVMYKGFYAKDKNEEVPAGYYDFLNEVPMNDPFFMSSYTFGSWINRFEYMNPFMAIHNEINQMDSVPSMDKRLLIIWHKQDSILSSQFGMENNLLSDVVKTRALLHYFKNMEKEDARQLISYLNKKLTHSFTKEEAQRLYAVNFTKEKQAYTLPEGKGTDIFRGVTDQFKGKYLLVDFWGIFCGPCIQSIKQMKETREKYKDHPDFDFVFITSDEESPKDRYDSFVAEQELHNTFVLSGDQYRYMRELFKFNGIPRYILVDKKGRIIDDNYSSYSFIQDMKRFTGKEEL